MRQFKILFASILGNTLEYYEFSIFAVFAIQIGQAFFPSHDSVNQILLTLALFGAGFLSRPLGSAIFGHIGDKLGRKRSLLLTITGMSVATFGIGFMPSYDTIGILAPISLLMLRLLQGLFIGGEGAGSAVYVLEHRMKMNRNVVGGFLITSNVSGIIIASIVGLIITKTVGLDQTTWRYAFIAGGVAGVIISYMRLTLPESERFNELSDAEKHKVPLVELFTKYWKQMLVVVSFAGFSSGVSYIIKGYLSVHFQKFMNLSPDTSFLLLMYTTVIFAILPPFCGMLSTKYTYRKLLRVTSILIIFLYVPIFILISTPNYYALIAGLTLMAVLAASVLTPTYIYFSDLFPTSLRYSGVAVSFNIGITLIGGFTPVMSTFLINTTKLSYSPALYIIALAVIYLVLESYMHKRIEYFK
jgi:MHS family proline/betaine transporter-like MFS transporter